jgi:DNA-binding NarL/FixJ family response regulator
MTLRVLVADPLPILRSGVRTFIEREPKFTVREASDTEQAVNLCKRGRFDVALVDFELGPAGAVEAVGAIHEVSPETHVVVWSFDPPPDAVIMSLRAGATGFLRKQIAPAGLVRALSAIFEGEAPLSRDLALSLVHALHALERRERARGRVAVLSAREREVLELVANGAPNRRVAEQLVISEFTVKRHMQNILQKLEVPTRHAATRFYRDALNPSADAVHARELAGTVT